uniref:PB1 domain-containing protein n=1 Tax=Monopterus albus TaxID=43700 RepID=A0A3Q3RC73_MONAL
MGVTDVLKLRVILDDVSAERLILPSRPETVSALIFEVKNKLNLTYDFRLQFQDPEFDNALCNLVNIEDLKSKATIKIVRLVESDRSSTSTDDTVLLSDNTDSPEHLCRWPEIFVVPAFSYEVEYALREGNSAFVKEGKMINSKQIGKAAEALVSKHPCLKENGSKSGYEGWKNSLHFKMGNYRTKLSRAGIRDVAVNAGKCSRTSSKGAVSRANIKRPRRGEVNFLPNYPSGETKGTLETQRLEMVEKFKKASAERDMILIHQHMQRTFALRREEIVNSAPHIAELKDRWPALFCDAQVSKNKNTLRSWHIHCQSVLDFVNLCYMHNCTMTLLHMLLPCSIHSLLYSYILFIVLLHWCLKCLRFCVTYLLYISCHSCGQQSKNFIVQGNKSPNCAYDK